MKRTHKEWRCNKTSIGNGIEYECFSGRGTAVSVFKDGSVRFTKFDCDKPVKVDGKVLKNKCGVEIY